MRKIKIIDCDLKLFSIHHIFDRLDKNFFTVYVTNNKQYDDFSKILPKINVFPIPKLFYIPKLDFHKEYNLLFLKSKKIILFDNIHINEIMHIIELANLIKQDKESESPCFLITKQYDYDPKKFFYAFNYIEVNSFNFNKIPKNTDFIIVNDRDDLIYSHFDTVFVGGTLMPGNIYNTDYNIPAMIHYNCVPIVGKFHHMAKEFVEFLDYQDIIIKKSNIYQLHIFYKEYLKSTNMILNNKTSCMKINELKKSSILAIANEINKDAK